MSQSTGTGRTHKGSRLIKASPHAIYSAFMTPEAVAAWRPPEGMRARFELFEPREGGAFQMVLEYEGTAHELPGKSSAHEDIVHGRFGELVPDRRIVEHVDFESDDPAFAGTMTVTTTLTPVDGGTEVTITCDDVPEGIGESDHQAGIASSLENLAKYVE
jgi:uncharacterized protein YndB with AHSA1/START domain